MATSGLSAWKKHFAGKGEIETTIKKSTRTFLPDGRNGPSLPIGTIIKVLPLKDEKEYLSYVRGRGSGTNVNAYIPITYKNNILLCSLNDMSKPKEGKVVDLKLQTINLVKGAKVEKFNLMGFENVRCAVFTSADQMRNVILRNIQNNKMLDTLTPFKISMIRYFKSNDPGKIDWIDAVSLGEKQQFAKYVAELILGFALFQEKNIVTPGNPFSGKKIIKFIVPLSESFAGADSFIFLNDETLIPISNKAGVGAPASFFTNILLTVFKNPNLISERCVLKDLYDTAIKLGINDERTLKNGAKKIIYEYGIRNLLNISESELRDTYKVFEEFKKFDDITKYSTEVRTVYVKLKSYMEDKNDITALKNIDSSTTVFFSKQIANLLNEDSKSMELMKNILGGKKFYQANLQLKKLFDNGEIEVKVITSGQAHLKIIGNKSAYTNIDADQGTLNFILKYQ